MSTFITKYAKEQNLVIADATKDIELNVSKWDVKFGDRTNPASCGLARCARRTYKVEEAFFFRTSAYLETGNALIRARERSRERS